MIEAMIDTGPLDTGLRYLNLRDKEHARKSFS
jgi:hypothetical protein